MSWETNVNHLLPQRLHIGHYILLPLKYNQSLLRSQQLCQEQHSSVVNNFKNVQTVLEEMKDEGAL